MASDTGALQDQTAFNIRERAGGRKQKPEREDGHLRTMGVAGCNTLEVIRPPPREVD